MNNEKNRRIEIMDQLFRQGTPVSFMDVAEALNNVFHKCKTSSAYAGYYGDVFRKDIRTIREVLNNPKNCIAPEMLKTAGGNRNRTYWYADPSFSVMPYLTYYYRKSDVKIIDKALDLLRDALPDEAFRSVEFALTSRMEYEFGKGEKDVDYGENYQLKGRRWLPMLYQALNVSALRIVYKPYTAPSCSYVLYPYLLKQYNNRWFLFGRIDEFEKAIIIDSQADSGDVNPNYWNVPLDRIESVEVLKDAPFVVRPENYSAPFLEIFGVTNEKGRPVEKVRFLVHGKTAHYLFTKPVHVSQCAHWKEEDSLDVTLRVKINYELKQLLLSYAPDITVLSPASLVEEHKAALRKALEQYGVRS